MYLRNYPLSTRWVQLLLLNLIAFTFCLSQALAFKTTKIEQQVNLITQEFTTTSTSSAPTDNSLGLIEYDGGVYNDETVYFEAVILCSGCSGGNAQAYAALYTDTGTEVTNSSVVTTSSTYSLVRSAAITGNLTNNEEYTVRILLDATSGTAFVRTARLIVLQSGADITDTQHQIEVGNTDTTTNSSYELMTAPKIYRWDNDLFSEIQAVYFEATQTNSAGLSTAYAALSSSTTCANTVTGSEVTTTGTTWARDRSADFLSSLVDDTDYWVCVKSENDDTASLASAKIVINQSEAGGIHDMQVIHQLINTAVTDTDTGYTSQNFLSLFDPAVFDVDDLYAYLDVTLRGSSALTSAFARLYNVTDSTNIVNTELDTQSTGYTRLRTADIRVNLPSTVKTLDMQLKNESTDTTTVSNAWLLYNLVRRPDPLMTFSVGAVANNIVNNGITTSNTSTFSTLPFGNLTFNTPRYAAHALYATTNASDGYSVQVKMLNFLQGLYPSNNIDPFIHAWTAPAAWTQPTGSTPNTDTGWFGANTTDSRVANWSAASEKFGAVTSTGQTVMYSSAADAGTTAYVTYAVEVNIWQPADLYQGTIVYHMLPMY